MRAASPSRAVSAQRIQRTLKTTFALSRLREGQQAVIERVLAGRNTLAIMPTGAGKSLCYQLPAVMMAGRTLVISPLIALMKDQCDKLQQQGIAAVQVNSALPAAEARASREAVADGSARIVFTTPEQLCDPAFVDDLQQHPVRLLAVDEAHCISEWGHDFRPAFLRIADLASTLGRPTVLALTATATAEVAHEICRQFGIPAEGVVNTPMYRPNLHYAVELVTDADHKRARLLGLVTQTEGAGIVYTATIKAAEEVHAALLGAEVSAVLYHGKLNASERRAAQEAFMAGSARVMVATNAFGLGIDKPDTRFVIHYQLPAGLDAYYQESGRAGRDGEAAQCTLLFLPRDKSVQQFFMAGRYPSLEDLDALYAVLRTPAPEPTGWSVEALCARLDTPDKKVLAALALLRRLRIVKPSASGHMKPVAGSLDNARLRALSTAYQEKRDRDQAMLELMVFYAQTGQCRWRVLLQHLEDSTEVEACQVCDACLRLARHEAGADDNDDAPAATEGHAGKRAGFAPGDAVRVKRYGTGTVASADSLSVTIAFANGAQRCFASQFVSAVGSRQGARPAPARTRTSPTTEPAIPSRR